ncbi:hypothetical protein [Sphingomonas sp. KR3-1]|uniref:hypothetical protein n=1 Tax=Sphingomonas sp. KR3-1 TaxID=3156611 RepID=UPI0032B53022
MGTKTDEYLASLLSDSFKREVDADEAVWRSLPFFGAMLGLAIALLPQIYRSAAGTVELPWGALIYTLLAASIISFAISAWWFWVVIRPREYRYPPSDRAILDYTEALRAFHKGAGSADEWDETVRNELRTFILDEFAQTTTNNRRNNNAKLRARSQVLLFAMAGFLVAFVCEATILASQAFSPVTEKTDGGWSGRKQAGCATAGQEGGRSQSPLPASAARAPMGLGRRELPAAPEAKGGSKGMSDSPLPSPPPSPPPPERPAPEWLKKDNSDQPREHR